jgi:hypothetical protein
MAIEIKPSDLYYRYQRKKETRDQPKFCGPPDDTPFDRDDLYDVIPMLEAVMNALGTRNGAILEKLEEVMIYQMPGFIRSRGQVFEFLVSTLADRTVD